MHFSFVLPFFIFYFILCILNDGLLKRQVIVISLGCCCCRHSVGAPQSSHYWSSCNVQGKIVEGEMDDDRGMVKEVEGTQNLGGREMLSCMRKKISICVVVVVVVLIVVVGVVVLIVVVVVMCLGEVEVDSG